MECKEENIVHFPGSRFVLIETLWNVKMSSCKLSSGYSIVLIETLWNAKKTDIAQIQLFGALY